MAGFLLSSYAVGIDPNVPHPTGLDGFLLNFNGANNATTTVDSSPFNHPVTLVGGAKIDLTGSNTKFAGSGVYNSASQNAYYEVAAGNVQPIGTQDFCLEGWAKPLAMSGQTAAFIRCEGYINIATQVDAGPRYTLRFIFANPDGTTVTLQSAAALSMAGTTWYHWALVRDAGVIRAYLNGALVGTGSCPTDFAESRAWRSALTVPTGGNLRAFVGSQESVKLTIGYPVYTADLVLPFLLPTRELSW
jgi:hypothetical protein